MDQDSIRRQIGAINTQALALHDALGALSGDQRAMAAEELARLRASLAQLDALLGAEQPDGGPKDASTHSSADEEDALIWSAERTTRLYAINTSLSVALTEAQAAHVVIDQALPALAADAGVFLLLVDGATLEPVAAPGGNDAAMEPVPLDDASPFGEAARTAQSVWIETPDDLNARYPSWATSRWRAAASLAVIPLIAEGRVLGVMGFRFDTARALPIADRAFMLVLAQQSAAALERVHLYEQVRQAAALQERNRLARDLHDSVAQALYAIILVVTAGRANLYKDLNRVERALDNILSLTGAAQADLRALLFDLRDDSIRRNGLVNALLERAQFLRQRHGLVVAADLCEEPALGTACKEVLYGIAREALHNALKHARATQVGLRLSAGQDGLRLEITDDGVGFEPGRLRPGHYGLQSMRERAAELGAEFQLESSPGQGTRVTVVVPFVGDTVASPHQPPCADGDHP